MGDKVKMANGGFGSINNTLFDKGGRAKPSAASNASHSDYAPHLHPLPLPSPPSLQLIPLLLLLWDGCLDHRIIRRGHAPSSDPPRPCQ